MRRRRRDVHDPVDLDAPSLMLEQQGRRLRRLVARASSHRQRQKVVGVEEEVIIEEKLLAWRLMLW